MKGADFFLGAMLGVGAPPGGSGRGNITADRRDWANFWLPGEGG